MNFYSLILQKGKENTSHGTRTEKETLQILSLR